MNIMQFTGTKLQWEALRDMDVALQSAHPLNQSLRLTYFNYILYLIARMQYPKWRAYLVVNNGEYVGFVSFYNDALGGAIGDAIYIKEKYRKKTAFKLLFDVIMNEAKTHRYIKADLLTDMEAMAIQYGFHKDCARYYLFSEEVKE